MTVAELQKITPRALDNKVQGYERAKQEAWERTRIQCYYSCLPYLNEADRAKGIEGFMPFTWDGDTNQTDWEALKAHAKAQKIKSDQRWAELEQKQRDVEQ